MMKLVCAIVGGGKPFPVNIRSRQLVWDLKIAIALTKRSMIECYAKELQVFLAKNRESGKWLRNTDNGVVELGEGWIHPNIQSMIKHGQVQQERRIGDELSANGMTFWSKHFPEPEQIHVLVRIPRFDKDHGMWDEVKVNPQVQMDVWQSVVRVSSGQKYSGTALAVDRTSTHVYLLTNLNAWIDENETFVKHMSARFKKEVARYLRLHPVNRNGGKQESNDTADLQSCESAQPSEEISTALNVPLVVVEQLLPGTSKLTKVLEFSLSPGICWRSSAGFDFIIFEVAVPPEIPLVRRKVCFPAHSLTHVYIFGFSGADQENKKSAHSAYAIIPAQITGTNGITMTLASFSDCESGIVCSESGFPVGCMGAALNMSKNGLRQSYCSTFNGIPIDLPSWMRQYYCAVGNRHL